MNFSDSRPDPLALFGPVHDAHCHLDFMSNGEEVARAAQQDGMTIFANTVTPSGFTAAKARFQAYPNVFVGLGMHPWWVDASFDAGQFERLASQTCFIGEVGLDFSERRAQNRDEQLDAFGQIAGICARQGGKLLSIHAVKSVQTVLDILERAGALDACTCIFHWFSDSSDALTRARNAGCYFSVNPMMLNTRRGREYVRQLPTNRLLCETDAPPGEGVAYEYSALAASLDEVRIALQSC